MPTGFENQIGRSIRGTLGQAEGAFGQAPGVDQIGGGMEQLLQLLRSLEAERGRVGQIGPASSQVQSIAHQAAFAPLQGMQPFLEQALTQASQAAGRRGLGRGSIQAALQAQAIPQIMAPALANAQGRYSELLLEVPFRERQQALQSIGLGGQLAGQQGQVFGQQQQLRESAFNQLLQAQASAQQEAQLQRQRRGGLGRTLGSLGGMVAGGFLGPLGGALGSRLGSSLFGGGGGEQVGSFGQGSLGSMPTGQGQYGGGMTPFSPSWNPLGPSLQMPATGGGF